MTDLVLYTTRKIFFIGILLYGGQLLLKRNRIFSDEIVAECIGYARALKFVVPKIFQCKEVPVFDGRLVSTYFVEVWCKCKPTGDKITLIYLNGSPY